ncbi:metallopeptidase family protein [Aestuariimicrobium kwangyangense]|uniref:metallopeptidase family protein n=1 Tax=Aestuariimicrobium kwangyangense TaxID=396389 RepID=UPI0003B48359|nr:metallopeptidase family protein [Aestuariimicrobium kwangyangense]
MPRHRDRHDRGMRGPLVPLAAEPPTRRAAHEVRAAFLAHRNPTAAAWFNECLTASLARIGSLQPGLLDHIEVGVEEVPTVREHDTRVPLAAAMEASATQPARVVVYRRPLEQRSTGRRHLRRLVHRTVVEQLAALTARNPRDIDPLVGDEDD